MYHISKDLRAQKSASLIRQGLERCLEEKPFEKIRVSDIYEKSFVSRATFYRLFDSITDVFAYECDCIMTEVLKTPDRPVFADKKEQALYCMNIWLSHPTLIKALIDNNLGWILYDTHAKHADLLKKIYPLPFESEEQAEYFISILSSLICGALSVYFKHGASEPIEEVYQTVCACTSIIATTFQ